MGPCLCGDTDCPSCGTAQGTYPSCRKCADTCDEDGFIWGKDANGSDVKELCTHGCHDPEGFEADVEDSKYRMTYGD